MRDGDDMGVVFGIITHTFGGAGAPRLANTAPEKAKRRATSWGVKGHQVRRRGREASPGGGHDEWQVAACFSAPSMVLLYETRRH